MIPGLNHWHNPRLARRPEGAARAVARRKQSTGEAWYHIVDVYKYKSVSSHTWGTANSWRLSTIT